MTLSLAGYLSPPRRQIGQFCHGWATWCAVEGARRIAGLPCPPLSASYITRWSQILAGDTTFSRTSGSIDLSVKAVSAPRPAGMYQGSFYPTAETHPGGVATLATWPDEAVGKPSAAADAEAPSYRILGYQQIAVATDPLATQIAAIKAALTAGHLVLFGCNISRQWLSAANGDVLAYTDADIAYSHAMVICGYDDDSPMGDGLRFTFRNSWGAGWGRDGNGTFPAAMLHYVTKFVALSVTATPIVTFPPPTPTGNAMNVPALKSAASSLVVGQITQPQIDNVRALAAALVVDAPVVAPQPRVEYIVNALPAGQAGPSAPGSVEFTGVWTTSMTPGRYLNDGLYSGVTVTTDPATPLSTYTFKSPPLPRAGNVAVYVWWAQNTTRSTSVPITVGERTVNFNQQTQGSQWVLHGTYSRPQDAIVSATISNANGQAAADAVRFVLE